MEKLYPGIPIRRPKADDPIFKEPVRFTSRAFTKPEDNSQKPTTYRDDLEKTETKEESHMDMTIIEAIKKGDRAGLPFEGSSLFPQQFDLLHQSDFSEAAEIIWDVLASFSQETKDQVTEKLIDRRLTLALKSNQGSDESSIIDCFIKFIERSAYSTDELFVWDWLCYHQQQHGTGYGHTYRDHFNLVAYVCSHGDKYPDLQSKIRKLVEIAADADSFGNGCLPLCYPAYCHAKTLGKDPAEFVRYLTGFTHANSDAIEAVSRLCSFIEDPSTIAVFYENWGVADDEIFRQRFCTGHATAYNTLVTAVKCAMKETEMAVIREAVRIGGDVDSVLATAMLVWSLKRVIPSQQK